MPSMTNSQVCRSFKKASVKFLCKLKREPYVNVRNYSIDILIIFLTIAHILGCCITILQTMKVPWNKVGISICKEDLYPSLIP